MNVFNLFLEMLFSIFFLITLSLPMLLFGIFLVGITPAYKKRKLTSELKEKIKKEGLVHFTSETALTKIISSQTLLPSKRYLSYSNRLKKATFFFAGMPDEEILRFNVYNTSKKKNHYVCISEVSEEVLDKIRYRKIDNAVFISGKFNFSNFKFRTGEIKKETLKMKFLDGLSLKYLVALLSCFASILVPFSIIVVLISKI